MLGENPRKRRFLLSYSPAFSTDSRLAFHIKPCQRREFQNYPRVKIHILNAQSSTRRQRLIPRPEDKKHHKPESNILDLKTSAN